MHNLDRNQLEIGYESGDFEYEADQETYGETYETYGEMYGEFEGPFSEADEMELAAELLSISSEEELDQFLGGLFKKIGRSVGKIIKGPIGKQLGGILKGVAKQALPMAGAALGSVVPGVGTALGGMAGSMVADMASEVYGLELEGMSAEDQEFEVARRFVRFAGDAAQEVAAMPQNVPPKQAVQAAVTTAAQKHAPGLLNGAGRSGKPGQRKRSGRWVRHGNAVILYGI